MKICHVLTIRLNYRKYSAVTLINHLSLKDMNVNTIFTMCTTKLQIVQFGLQTTQLYIFYYTHLSVSSALNLNRCTEVHPHLIMCQCVKSGVYPDVAMHSTAYRCSYAAHLSCLQEYSNGKPTFVSKIMGKLSGRNFLAAITLSFSSTDLVYPTVPRLSRF